MFRTLAILASILGCVHSYKPCLHIQPVPVDDAWFSQAGLKGMHIPLHSRCNNCENEENWKWVKNDPQANVEKQRRKREVGGENHIYCWGMGGITQLTATGVVRLSYQCEHRGKIEEQYCTGVIPKIRTTEVLYAGSNVITQTDNSTYIAGATCMFGRENFWWMAFTTPDAPPETVKSIEDHFKSLGFTAVTATEEHHAPVILKEMTMAEC